MKILVIGATGLLAKPVAKVLQAHGHEIRLFSRSITKDNAPSGMEVMPGDVFNSEDLEEAVKGCDVIHISISRTNETAALKQIVTKAKTHKVKLITFVSGNSVREENRWFRMMEDKLEAEKTLMNSGIPWMIFRATWFFESLSLMVRNKRASVIGKQPHKYHWLAGSDFGEMIAKGMANEKAWNKVHYVLGPEEYTIKEALTLYCEHMHPGIKKVGTVPIRVLKLMALLSRDKELRMVADMFKYFQKMPEHAANGHENELIGKAETTLETWVNNQKSK